MKKFRVWIGLVLCAALVMTTSVSSQATGTSGVTSDTIKEMEQQISNAEKEMKDLKNSLSDIKTMVNQLENEKTSLDNYVEQLDKTLAVIDEKIQDLKNQIAQKETELADTQAQLEEAQRIEEEQYVSMGERIKCSYERGEYHFLEQIFTVKSFSDLLNRITYEEELAKYEKQKLDEYIANREYIALCEKQLQVEKEYLEAMKTSVENEQAATEALLASKKQEIEKSESSIASKEQSIKEYEAEIAEQNELIKQLEKAVEEEKEKLNKKLMYDGGTFAFPLETYTRISDDYGYRIHPILNVKQFHNGVDFAAPKGTAIYAAYDGVVVAATYSATMGNYVMIDHGDGLYTIYMHASKLNVSKDAEVKRGQKIAEVGSTGRSTGNHLHFTVRKNGSYVSPWEYLSK